MTSFQHVLDYNQYYRLNLDYNRRARTLTVTIDDHSNPSPRFVENVLSQLTVTAPARIADQTNPPLPSRSKDGRSLTFRNIARAFTLRHGTLAPGKHMEPLGTYNITKSGELERTMYRPLTVDETRRIGTFYQCPPYRQRDQYLLELAKHTVFTDFHTHSSGQISPHGLIAAAMKHQPYYYPIDLLKAAGINTDYTSIPKKHRHPITRIPFPQTDPADTDYTKEIDGADLHALTADDLNKLAARMAIPADRQGTFAELEFFGYRFRTPMSKNPKLNADIRRQEAKEYLDSGIQFALTSYTSIDKPEILHGLHDFMAEFEKSGKEKRFTQRFMIGIPRGLSPAAMKEELEKAKILLDSPYIVGVDILGYEANKTKEFVHILDDFAAWANKRKPGAIIRVHAGENDKNYDNVKDFLKIAVKHDRLHYLVGHGIYGMDDETTRLAARLAKNNQLTLEFNPSSNIANNNINDVAQIPFENAIRHGLPFIVGSDAAGMYHTDPTQLGLAAYYGGLREAGFEALATHQHQLMAKIKRYSHDIAAKIPNWETTAGKKTQVDSILERLETRKQEAKQKAPAQTPEEKEAKAKKVKEELQHKIDKILQRDEVSLIELGDSFNDIKERMPSELSGKVPITIFGASGASWERMTQGQQRESAIIVDMLIHALGTNAYIVQGRNKSTGLSLIINEAVKAANTERKNLAQKRLFPEDSELRNVGMLVNPSFEEKDSYKHLSHMIHLPPQPLKLAESIVDLTFALDGVLLGIGGSAYSSDIIHAADIRGIRDKDPSNNKMMLLMRNCGGASAEKAANLHPDYGVADGKQLIKKLHSKRPELFPRGFKPTTETLDKLYEASRERVKSYKDIKYNKADVQEPAPPLAEPGGAVEKELLRRERNVARTSVNPKTRGA